jgi:hypothetical protein
MQYTTRTANEIYEGDILSLTYEDDEGGGAYKKGVKGKVYFVAHWFDCRDATQRTADMWVKSKTAIAEM